jgi:hypothetical protein
VLLALHFLTLRGKGLFYVRSFWSSSGRSTARFVSADSSLFALKSLKVHSSQSGVDAMRQLPFSVIG